MLKSLFKNPNAPAAAPTAPESFPILDAYVQTAPSNQATVDVFKGEWASRLPDSLGVESGQALLFQDPRITWALQKLGGVKGQKMLELGPLEAGHSYMLEQAGAASITAVEANSRAYLKCLMVKEMLGLKTRFLLGELNAYLDACTEKFDLCLASGVLYHQTDPVETLRRIGKVSDRTIIWTHYYDRNIIPTHATTKRFETTPQKKLVEEGYRVNYWRREYHDSLNYAGFCGGAAPYAHWMERQDILRVLNIAGFTTLEVSRDHEQPGHPNGPCLILAASK